MDKASQLTQLQNDGIGYTNLTECPDEATVIVVGAPRSGTSMIANALISLGVHMGDQTNDSVFEDLRIRNSFLHDIAALPGIIQDYNARYPVWGFKYPMAFRTMSEKIGQFRNPRFIIPFRDPMAIAKRKEVSLNESALQLLRSSAKVTLELAIFVQELEVPAMMMSYEKTLSDPERTLEKIAAFSGLTPDAAKSLTAAEIVKNGPEPYILASQSIFPTD